MNDDRYAVYLKARLKESQRQLKEAEHDNQIISFFCALGWLAFFLVAYGVVKL